VPRVASIVVLIVVGALVVGLLAAAALVVAAGSGSESAEPEQTLALQESARRLELPLAENEQTLTLAQRKGRVLVGIAARQGGPVEIAAVEGETPIAGERLSFALDEEPVAASPCGTACWRLDVSVLDGPSVLVVKTPAVFRFELPPVLPPSGTALFRKVQRTMKGLRTYRYTEELTSGAGPGLRSTFEVRAPNRLRFRTADGFSSIIVGRSRWDLRDGTWERSPFPGLRVPVYMWDGARNARLLGRGLLSVYDREPIPAWFRLVVDARGRVVRAEMLAPSHFMEQHFGRFNAPLSIRPPA
jgi:hypothetical protein